MRKTRIPLVLLLGLHFLAGCGTRPSVIEEKRLRSPDGKVDAVLYRTPTDPLSSDILSIRLEPVGAKLEWDGVVLHATHTDTTFAMRWAAERLLEVTYAKGHLSGFDNEWWTYRLDPQNRSAYFVEIRLIKQPEDSAHL